MSLSLPLVDSPGGPSVATSEPSPPPTTIGNVNGNTNPSIPPKPRLVRKPKPVTTYLLPDKFRARSDWSWTNGVGMVVPSQSSNVVTNRNVTKVTDTIPASIDSDGDICMRDASCIDVGSTSQSIVPPVTQESTSQLGSMMDDGIDYHAIDLDAIMKTSKPTNSNSGVIDLTIDSQMDPHPTPASATTNGSNPPTAPASAPGAMVDIEDLMKDLAAQRLNETVPLRLRSPWQPHVFSVTEFSSMNWCEKQIDLGLRIGKRRATPEAQARMDAGTAIHLAYELETVEKVNVVPESREDHMALRLLNMMMGVQELVVTGRTRELPVFGCIQLPQRFHTTVDPSAYEMTPGDAKQLLPSRQVRSVWIIGIIDEVVRLDLFERDQWRKRQERDALVASKSPKRSTATEAKSKTDSSAAPSSAARSKSVATIGADSTISNVNRSIVEKRKRTDAHEFEKLWDAPRSPKQPSTVAESSPPIRPPLFSRAVSTPIPSSLSFTPNDASISVHPPSLPSTLASSIADDVLAVPIESADVVLLSCDVNANGKVATTIRATPPSDTSTHSQTDSQSLVDMDISDDDLWQLMSGESEQQWKIERQMSQEEKDAQALAAEAAATVATKELEAKELETKTAAAEPSSPRMSRSVSLPAAGPMPHFPISCHHVVLDHKTRAANSMPSVAQKIGTYLQISIYKLLLDRWLGADESQQKHRNAAVLWEDELMEEKKSNPDDCPTDQIPDDPSMPPFSMTEFFEAFELDPTKQFGLQVQSHLTLCGLSPELTIGDLLMFSLASFKTMHRTYKEMKVEYEYQKGKSLIGSDTYTFDRKWLDDEINHHMAYWCGHRSADAVSLSDGFKCTRCDYADSCDERVQKYKRVGRLIVPTPLPLPIIEGDENELTPNEATPAGGATSAHNPDLDEPQPKRQKIERTASNSATPLVQLK